VCAGSCFAVAMIGCAIAPEAFFFWGTARVLPMLLHSVVLHVRNCSSLIASRLQSRECRCVYASWQRHDMANIFRLGPMGLIG
jgi:hypothetical protein